MTRAENIQQYIKVEEMKTEDTSLEEELDSRRFFASAMSGL